MEDFIDRMRSINLKSDDTIVIYDNYGIYSAPRMAWTLRYFGASNIKVLNGGLKKWVQERRLTESGSVLKQKKGKQEGNYAYQIEEAHLGIVDVNTI